MDQPCSSNQPLLNLSGSESAKDYQQEASESFLQFVIMPLIMVIGVLGNLAFLIAVLRIPRMKTMTNFYLGQVAATDILFLVFSTGSYISRNLNSSVRFATKFEHWSGCFSTFFIPFVTYMASLLLITLVTVERFYAICYPLKMRRITGDGRSRKILASLWLSSFCLSAIAAQRYARLQVTCIIWPSNEDYSSFAQVVRYCVPSHPKMLVVSEFMLGLPYFILLPLNLYMYTMIIYTLSNRLPLNEIEQANTVQTKKVRNQVARLLIFNGVVFFICQSSIRAIAINNIVQELADVSLFTPPQYALLILIGRILVFINSAINPFIYIATSQFYRNAIFEAVSCIRRNAGERNEQISMNTSLGKTI